MNLNHHEGTYYNPAKLRMQEGGNPQQEILQKVMQLAAQAFQPRGQTRCVQRPRQN